MLGAAAAGCTMAWLCLEESRKRSGGAGAKAACGGLPLHREWIPIAAAFCFHSLRTRSPVSGTVRQRSPIEVPGRSGLQLPPTALLPPEYRNSKKKGSCFMFWLLELGLVWFGFLN